MLKRKGDYIYTGSLIFLIFFTITDVELYTLGSRIGAIAGRDAWLSVILGAGASYIFLFLLVKLAQRFPRQTFFEYCPQVWGKFLSLTIVLAFLGYWFIYSTRLHWRVAYINTPLFLPNTPLIILLLTFILGAIFLASYGLTPITRFMDLMLLFFFIPYGISTIITLANVDWSYFFPILGEGIMPVLKGAVEYSLILQGIEIVLFAIPFTENPKKTLLPALAGLSLVHVAVFVQLIGVIGIKGTISAPQYIYPSAAMLTTLRVPGWPVERFEPFLTLPWLIAVFTTATVLIYLISSALQFFIGLKNPKLVYYGVGVATVAATYLIPNILWSMVLDDILLPLMLLVIYGLPLLTLGLAYLRGKKGGQAG